MNKQQLANKIWASANKMRSKIDANEYKDYILGLVFYKFLSDNEVNYILKDMKGASEEEQQQALQSLVENYDDENSKVIIDYCKNNIGYFIEYKNLFSTWLLPDSNFTVSDLSVALNSFDRLVSQNYKPVYDGIFKTLQAGLSKLGENPASQTRALKDLIKLIKDIPTDGSQDYDVLGYVYEFLIGNFAANAGKKAGEFYTPHEVAILMSEIVAEHHKDKRQIEIYDPTSGSGSLLITIGKSVGRHISDKNRVKYYAQELKENTYNLTRMNLVMRGIQPSNINTRCADSLDEDWPVYKAGSEIGQPLYVDAVVSNPPYSQHWDPTDRENDARFKDYGVAPKSKADYAFLLHELHHLKPDGILTIVLPHGVLFRSGEEEIIRKNLIEKNNIDAIIGLPGKIFFGTPILTLIMVLKQHREDDSVLFIDASKGFVKDGKQNKLRACDIKKIADAIKQREDIHGFAKNVSRDEIRENDYNLNIPRYVDSSEAVEQFDIYATMFSGIPNSEIDSLQEYWNALPSLRNDLFLSDTDKPYSSIKVDDAKSAIEQNVDVKWFKTQFTEAFKNFENMLHKKLIGNVKNVRELQDQDEIAADIFHRLEPIPLVDKYAAYQALSDNWQSIIGDIETIQQDGIEAVRVVETAYKIVKKNDEEVEVADGLKGRIIPFDLVQTVKFQAELDAILALQAKIEDICCELDEIHDSFTDEETDAFCDSEKDNAFDKTAIKAGAKPKSDVDQDTKDKLKKIVELWDEQSRTNKQIKEGKQVLTEKTVSAIANLSDDEVNQFLHMKWIDPIIKGINDAFLSSISIFEDKIQGLVNKYAVSYEDVNDRLATMNKELSSLISQLDGDEFEIKGLSTFIPSSITSLFPIEGSNLPKVRFKGYSDPWRKVSLNECLEISMEKNSSNIYGKNEVLTVSDEVGVVNQIKFMGRSYAGASVTGYKILRPNQIVYTKSPLKAKPYGIVKVNRGDVGIVSVLYAVYNVKDTVSPEYLHYFFDPYFRINHYLMPLVNKGAKNTMNISDETAISGKIMMPTSKDEQAKIARFFFLMDEIIKLESQRLEKLKQIKSACLDKMFV